MTDIKPCNVRNNKALRDLLSGLLDGEKSVAAKILDGTHFILAAEAVERISQMDENDLSTIGAACNEIRVFPDDLGVCEASLEKITLVSVCFDESEGSNVDLFIRQLVAANGVDLTKSCFSKYAESSSAVVENAAPLLTRAFHLSNFEPLLHEARMDSSFAPTIVAALKKYTACDHKMAVKWILRLISAVVSFNEDDCPMSPFQDALFSGSCDVLDLVVSALRKFGVDTDTVDKFCVWDAEFVLRVLLHGIMAPQPQDTHPTTRDIGQQYLRMNLGNLQLVTARTHQEVRRQLLDDEDFSYMHRGLNDLGDLLIIFADILREDNDDGIGEEEGGEITMEQEEEEEPNGGVSNDAIDASENVSSKRQRLE